MDKYVRSCQEGQTIGIPIGPDTSFLVAELLLAHVDRVLAGRLGDAPGVRFMDEWQFAFGSLGEAERCLATIEDALTELELSLNPEKMGISECPVPLRPDWVTALRRVPLEDRDLSPHDAVTLFDTAFELRHQHPGKAVLNWALSRVMSCTFGWATWKVLEPMILQCASSEPGSLPRVLRLLDSAQQGGAKLHFGRLKETLATVIEFGTRRSHWSEVAWALWGHILFNLQIEDATASLLGQTNDVVVALVALDARERGLMNDAAASSSLTYWENTVSTASLDDQSWLLIYEATVQGWLPLPRSPLLGDAEFEDLAKTPVFFYRGKKHAMAPSQLMQRHRWSAPMFLTIDLGYP